MDITHPTPESDTPDSKITRPVQLQLAGLESIPPGIDPRFILSDEMCRNGLRHIAEIRRRLAGNAQHQAA